MSLWEARMVHARGRLTLERPVATWLHEAAGPGIVMLFPLAVSLVATAQTHRLSLATHDRAMQTSGVMTIRKGSA